MTWFDRLTGFPEKSPEFVRQNLRIENTRLSSLVSGASWEIGKFSTPTLRDLRESTDLPELDLGITRVSEMVADVKILHQDPNNEHAVFQVASQFNCLEMASPSATPEDGVGIYGLDLTQGPACSICAGAATIFRNYFVPLGQQIGQSTTLQIDCIREIGDYFRNDEKRLWEMQNGYCFPTKTGLAEIESNLKKSDLEIRNDIGGRLSVGWQANTEVTTSSSGHFVSQVFCSALPIAYSNVSAVHWRFFPQLILDATYEATFYLALENFQKTGCNRLYLTLVGGGVFGNELNWILSAIERSLKLFRRANLEVFVVSYRSSNPSVSDLVKSYNNP